MSVEWSVEGIADLAERNPEPPAGGEAHTASLCAVLPYTNFIFIYFYFQFLLIHIFYKTYNCGY
jgi:hypothetical protein